MRLVMEVLLFQHAHAAKTLHLIEGQDSLLQGHLHHCSSLIRDILTIRDVANGLQCILNALLCFDFTSLGSRLQLVLASLHASVTIFRGYCL